MKSKDFLTILDLVGNDREKAKKIFDIIEWDNNSWTYYGGIPTRTLTGSASCTGTCTTLNGALVTLL